MEIEIKKIKKMKNISLFEKFVGIGCPPHTYIPTPKRAV